MGCGSSSLKGDDLPNLNSQPINTADALGGQPMKKVRTDFSDINYEQDAQQRRMTEYAPHETPAPIREQSISTEQPQDIIKQQKEQLNLDGGGSVDAIDPGDTTLKPYQTFDGGDWDKAEASQAQAKAQAPVVNGTDSTDPTSSLSKFEFASANDPANPANQENHHHQHPSQSQQLQAQDSQDGSTAKKGSWLGLKYSSFQSSKRGSGISDEELKKYTGKDREELREWAKNRGGVGGGQPAGAVVSADSGMAVGAAWT